METPNPARTRSRGFPKHPPSSKPLPSLPRPEHLVLSKRSGPQSLLAHPVPSPSLLVDMLSLMDEQASCTSSTPSSTFSYRPSYRDSTSSLVEFTQELLPPTPCSDRHFAAVNAVDCRLQDNMPKQPKTLSSPSALRHSPAPEQLHNICSKLDNLHIGRRDSAIFDTTVPIRPKPVRACTDSNTRHVTQPMLHSAHRSTTRKLKSSTTMYQIPPPASGPLAPVSSSNEVSFIDWDDEEPRLLRMKKTITDLRGGYRLFPTNTAVATNIQTAPAVSCATSRPNTIVATNPVPTPHPVSDTNVTRTPSATVRGSVRRKSVARPKTNSIMDTVKRLSRPDIQRQTSSSSNSSRFSLKRKRTSITASTKKSGCPPNSFSRLTSWMKNAVNNSTESLSNSKRTSINSRTSSCMSSNTIHDTRNM